MEEQPQVAQSTHSAIYGRLPHLSKAFLSPWLQVLLFHDQNYGIHYEYTIPVNQSTENQSEPAKPQDALFLWTHSGWEGCSVQCGGGKMGLGEARMQLG